ncbi:helix-turn-helix domain-containing protein [Saccharopolyspora sp. WRP15-2]|uniref:Helix-turn-helix domain-containing protein n=1 Tax=Saccharopolyspora oryzae TaxID=2997343 RepID=A0ABT4UQD6_9PSEU|nr:helix-turn-helix domain-containing protein [Saccharopolyspora oryzae]MDA3623946.1 helix-turn-helix domain-containing protein [Saccharopolyspora oryzae]
MSQDLWDQLERRAPEIADRAIQAYAAASPRYQGTVPEHLYRHMAHTTREFARLYVRVVKQERELHDDELLLFANRGRERGAEGLPIADFMDAYLVGARTIWDELSRLSRGAPPAVAGDALLRCLQSVMHAGFQAHQEESQAAHSEERENMRAVVRALVDGQATAEFADRVDLRLADSYAILALRFAPHPSESVGDAVGRRLAGRRKVHRITEELTRSLADDALVALDPDGGLFLVPSEPDRAAADLAAARAAIPRLQRAAGIDVMAGFAHAGSRAEVPAAAGQARHLAQLGSPAEVAVLDDLLFEYQLHHSSEAVPHFLSIVDELRREPDLLVTLKEYFAADFNRRQTARQLHVHPNTIDNRLSRIAKLTGANPRTARGLMSLAAALTIAAESPS